MSTSAELEEALRVAEKIKRALQKAKDSGESQQKIDEIQNDLDRILVAAGELQRADNESQKKGNVPEVKKESGSLGEIQSASDAVLDNLRERKAYTAEIAAKANAIDAASPTAKEDLAAIKAEYDSATEKFRSKQKQLTDTFIRLGQAGAGFFNRSQTQAIIDRTNAEMNSIMSGGNPAEPALGAKSKEITQTAAVNKESAASNTAASAVTDAEKNTTPLEEPIPEASPDTQAQSPQPKTVSKVDPPSQNKISEENKKNNSNARPNPLFEYANYTYGLSLHVVPPKIYNNLMTVRGFQYVPMTENGIGTVLIASGGKRNDTNFKRHPDFNEDFYFKELKFTTVVGLSARTKNTNAIDMSFTIVEPYGITLINRLLSMAKNIKTQSWMQIPFLMEINFYGNTSSGEPQNKIIGQTKYIPIKIIGCKVKVNKDGAEYQISAIPFNHQAFIDSNVRTPAAFEVTAKTVGDFFSSDLIDAAGEAAKMSEVNKGVSERRESLIKEADEERKNKNPNSNRLAELEKSQQELGKAASSSNYLVGSYAAAINSFQEQLVSSDGRKLQQYPEKYSFVIDKSIADSAIVFPEKTAVNKINMPDLNSQAALAEIRSKAGIQSSGFDRSKESFGINPGTSIVDVINQVMRNSSYIRNEITDPTIDVQKANDSDIQNLANKTEKKINWFKIIPLVTLKDFDLVRDTYSKEITYYIKKYTFHNTKIPTAAQSVPKAALKEYHYMFTGKNDSIINFDLDFDTMFYTVLTADKAKLESTTTSVSAEENEAGKVPLQKSDVGVQDNVKKYVTNQMDISASAGGSPDAKGQAVNDLYKASLSNSKGDMISVKLKIVGDPEFIKQDDVFFNPGNSTVADNNSDNPMDDNGSLVFDNSEMHALLTFRTPMDFDPKTGLAIFDGKANTSVFSGMYRIITIENEFRSGEFIQNLDLIRMFGQDNYDTISATNTSSQANRQSEVSSIADSTDYSSETDSSGSLGSSDANEDLYWEKGSELANNKPNQIEKIKQKKVDVVNNISSSRNQVEKLKNDLKNAPSKVINDSANFFE